MRRSVVWPARLGRRVLGLGLALAACGVCAAGAAGAAAPEPAFVDPLDAPAAPVADVSQRVFMALGRAGGRLVAVGMRGLIATSEDDGRHWRQAASPVQSDLTALCLVDGQTGWAVGHDGVVLASRDGGRTWQRRLDGRAAGPQFAEHYRALQRAGTPGAEKMLQEIERNYRLGPTLPFLDVAFDDAQHGYAVGPFGLIAATEDGGRTWQPWLERADNPELLSFYAARRIGQALYLVGERGMVYRLDRQRRSFVRLPTGYAGSLFGIAGHDGLLVAYGLRGTLAISRDGGASWAVQQLPVPASITSATTLADGRVVLGNVAGMLWLIEGPGSPARPLISGYPAPITALQALGADRIVVAGVRGVAVQGVSPVPRP